MSANLTPITPDNSGDRIGTCIIYERTENPSFYEEEPPRLESPLAETETVPRCPEYSNVRARRPGQVGDRTSQEENAQIIRDICSIMHAQVNARFEYVSKSINRILPLFSFRNASSLCPLISNAKREYVRCLVDGHTCQVESRAIGRD